MRHTEAHADTPRRQKTRALFIQTFIMLVLERGYEHITVTDIAAAARYGRWAFYQYFETKEALAWAAFEAIMTALDADVIAGVSLLDPSRREYESWRRIAHYLHAQRSLTTQLGPVLLTTWQRRLKEYLIAQFSGHIAAGRFRLMDGVRPEVAARLMVAALIELIDFAMLHQQPSDDEIDRLIDEFYTFIFNRPPPTDAR